MRLFKCVSPKTHVKARSGISFLCAVLFLLASCSPSVKQISGIYTGAITDATETKSEVWLQLFSNGSFLEREIRYTVPVSTKIRTGQWTLTNNLVVLRVAGEKDIRLRWEHGFLRDESASMSHPDLPLDMVALQRIGQ